VGPLTFSRVVNDLEKMFLLPWLGIFSSFLQLLRKSMLCMTIPFHLSILSCNVSHGDWCHASNSHVVHWKKVKLSKASAYLFLPTNDLRHGVADPRSLFPMRSTPMHNEVGEYCTKSGNREWEHADKGPTHLHCSCLLILHLLHSLVRN
jgi:hypothetical protein